MHTTARELFGGTVEKTCGWLDELVGETGWAGPERAYSALRAVLHTLRDRLTVDEAVNLGAQLPTLVRGFYYEGWRPQGRSLKYRHKAEFLDHIGALCPWLTEPEREAAARAVFKMLGRHVTGGEIQQAIQQLPEEVRDLWKTSL